jgi:4-amino-4-deoxy-L-arabinose transferase-like glycosyltransferase
MTRIGIQNDEAWFAGPIYLPGSALYYFRIGTLRAAMMRASYIGTLKTLLWTPIFGLFGPNAWSVREPSVLLGALTIWLFFVLLRRVAGGRAAAVGAVLLAADSMFLLTTCYDFGPEVVGHIPLIGAFLLLVRFLDSGRERDLAGASLLVGLALWDKALALWLLGAMGVAGLLFYPRPMWKLVTPRRVGLAVFWIVLGALPLVLYNIHSHLGTLRQNALPDHVPVSTKLLVLRGTFDGSIMGEFVYAKPSTTPAPRAPSSTIERMSAWLSAATGHPFHHWIIYAFMLAVVLALMASPAERRMIWFCLVTMAIAWAQMVWTTKSGTSVHHTILMWPLPQAIMGISFAAASRRLKGNGVPVLAGLLIVLTTGCTLVTNEYYTAMARNGGAVQWTTAIQPLAEYLKTQRASTIYTMDWGFLYNLALLDRGTLPLALDMPDEQRDIPAMLSRPDALFVAHSPEMVFFPQRDASFLAAAARLGYRQDVVKVISDEYGRQVFVVYRMTR